MRNSNIYIDTNQEDKRSKIINLITTVAIAILLIVVIVATRTTSEVDEPIVSEEPIVIETPSVTTNTTKPKKTKPQLPITLNEPDVIIPEEPLPEFVLDEAEINMLARLVWGEARGCSKTEQAAVIWCVLNRMDSENPDFPYTVKDVVTQPNQFYYKKSFPLEPELVELAKDVMTRWLTEKLTDQDVGRVLPQEYCWFGGDGKHNWFRDSFEFKDANIWYWSLPSPYEE